jgi:hypothetical protein
MEMMVVPVLVLLIRKRMGLPNVWLGHVAVAVKSNGRMGHGWCMWKAVLLLQLLMMMVMVNMMVTGWMRSDRGKTGRTRTFHVGPCWGVVGRRVVVRVNGGIEAISCVAWMMMMRVVVLLLLVVVVVVVICVKWKRRWWWWRCSHMLLLLPMSDSRYGSREGKAKAPLLEGILVGRRCGGEGIGAY